VLNRRTAQPRHGQGQSPNLFTWNNMNVAAMNPAKRKVMLAAAIGLLVFFLGFNIVSLVLVGPYAWDDGTITLAYARTLAENRSFALTGVSEIAEGSSSLLFVFLMAALHAVFHFGFDGLIRASQFVTLFFVVVTLWLVFRELRITIPDVAHRLLLVGLFSLFPVFTTEVHNGMEMSLMAFLLTAFYVAFRNSSAWVYLLVPALLLTRFEAVFYLGFALASYVLFQRDDRRRAFSLGLYTLLVFGVIAIGRWFYFGDVVPNTIHAKLHAPYSLSGTFGEKLLLKSRGLLEFVSVTAFLLIPALVGACFPLFRSRRLDLGALLIISFGVFALVSGKNWGYDGRMFLASLPLMLLVLAKGINSPEFQGHAAVPTWLRLDRFADASSAIFWPVALAVVLAIAANYKLLAYNVNAALIGGQFQGMLPGNVGTPASIRFIQNAKARDWYGITPANYRLTGLAVEGLRKIVGLEKIVFMAPDVGGLALCCQQIQIVDSGLLTNTHLARNGYAALPAYLEQIKPEVIETHGMWSQASKIFESRFFLDNYRPLVFNNNFFWIRSDLMPRVMGAPNVVVSEFRRPAAMKGVRYGELSGPDADYWASRPDASVPTVTTR
jgi:hypothetical protein